MQLTTPNKTIRLVTIGSIQLDVFGEVTDPLAVGAKQPANVTLNLGGAAANVVRGLPRGVYGISVIGAVHPSLRPWHTEELKKLGVTAIIRDSDELAVSIRLSGDDGDERIYVQRATLRLEDLDDEVWKTIEATDVVVVGPMAVVNDETLAMLRLIATRSKLAVHIPHLSLIRHARFGEIARLFSCVILNAVEAAELVRDRQPRRKFVQTFAAWLERFRSKRRQPNAAHVAKSRKPILALAALKLRHLTEHHTEFLITNGTGQGLMWAGGNWRRIHPHKIGPCRNDVGAGDTFAGIYTEGRFLRGLDSGLALERALAGVALHLAARNGLPCPGPLAPIRSHDLVKPRQVSRLMLGPVPMPVPA